MIITITHLGEIYRIVEPERGEKTLLAISLLQQLISGLTDTSGFQPTQTVRFLN
ncbi:MAG: hypothetical protein AAF577_13110 [Pseudomonadota bacterium]